MTISAIAGIWPSSPGAETAPAEAAAAPPDSDKLSRGSPDSLASSRGGEPGDRREETGARNQELEIRS